MKKSNPLFVDSTKFSGDAIFTQVELEKIPRYLGETISIKVTDKTGAEQETVLERTSETQCSGQVFLRHQQEVTYQFFVSRNGDRIFYSLPKTIRASYLIYETWVAVPVNPSLLTEPLSEKLPETVVEPIVEAVPESACEAIPESVPEAVSAAVSAAVSEAIPEPVFDNVSVPEFVPESVLELVPEPAASSASKVIFDAASEPVFVAAEVPISGDPNTDDIDANAVAPESEPQLRPEPTPLLKLMPSQEPEHALEPVTAMPTATIPSPLTQEQEAAPANELISGEPISVASGVAPISDVALDVEPKDPFEDPYDDIWAPV